MIVDFSGHFFVFLRLRPGCTVSRNSESRLSNDSDSVSEELGESVGLPTLRMLCTRIAKTLGTVIDHN